MKFSKLIYVLPVALVTYLLIIIVGQFTSTEYRANPVPTYSAPEVDFSKTLGDCVIIDARFDEVDRYLKDANNGLILLSEVIPVLKKAGDSWRYAADKASRDGYIEGANWLNMMAEDILRLRVYALTGSGNYENGSNSFPKLYESRYKYCG
jgi:hypothetical protein